MPFFATPLTIRFLPFATARPTRIVLGRIGSLRKTRVTVVVNLVLLPSSSLNLLWKNRRCFLSAGPVVIRLVVTWVDLPRLSPGPSPL